MNDRQRRSLLHFIARSEGGHFREPWSTFSAKVDASRRWLVTVARSTSLTQDAALSLMRGA